MNSLTNVQRCGAFLLAVLLLGAPLERAWAGAWSNQRPMDGARSHMGAAVLDGEVYVAGGTGILGPIADFEAYDPKGDHWRPLPSLPSGRQQFGMAAIDGRIVVTGGYQTDAPNEESAEMWIYDPRTSRWSQGPAMPGARAAHALVAADGRLYVLGGIGEDAAQIFVFDLEERAWSVAPFRLPAARAGLAAAHLDGRIYVAGGRPRGGTNTARLDILDLETGAWRRGAAMPGARAGLAMSAMGGRVHAAGGASLEDMRTFGDHFVYDPASDSWTSGTPLPTPRHSMASAQVGERWYVMGGGTGVGFFTVFTDADVVEMYDPGAD